jgi:C4-dicarboxylate-specific signal transduction histidine kinase
VSSIWNPGSRFKSGRVRKAIIRADAAQIEQVLINLLHNAVDAALETHGNVTLGWREKGNCVEILVEDEGPGIMNPPISSFRSLPRNRKAPGLGCH